MESQTASAIEGAQVMGRDLGKTFPAANIFVFPNGTISVTEPLDTNRPTLTVPVAGTPSADFTVNSKRYESKDGVIYDVVMFPGQGSFTAVCLEHDPDESDTRKLSTGLCARSVLQADAAPA